MTVAHGSVADALASRIEGAVLRPADPEFAPAVAGFDPTVAHHPDVVVVAADASDVAQAIAVARDFTAPVTILGTGHADIAPITAGVLISLRSLTDVDLDAESRRVTVGAGANWHDVLAVTTPHGLAPVTGSAPDVGAVGFLLGGGMGPVGRTFGYAADHVVAFEVVTASGEVVSVDADHHPDLFWALRGGKGGLAVALSATVDLLTLPAIYGGSWYVTATDIAAVLTAFQRLAVADLPEQLTASLAILRMPDVPALPVGLRGATVGHVRIGFVGEPEDGAAVIAPLREAAPVLAGEVTSLPYARIGKIHNDPVVGQPHVTAGILLREFPSEAVTALLGVAGPDRDVPLTIVEIRHLGGAFAEPQASPDAVGGRDAAFGIWVSAVLPPGPDGHEAARNDRRAAVRSVLDALAPWSTGAAQINFLGDTNTAAEFAGAWPPDITARLARVREHYDPDGLLQYRPL